ncbi:hypothetical protein APHAL10511_006644 [Amanita phalloides]|nr:hypothetical protein APHAL10511_006644 [Amanita phalloides]
MLLDNNIKFDETELPTLTVTEVCVPPSILLEKVYASLLVFTVLLLLCGDCLLHIVFNCLPLPALPAGEHTFAYALGANVPALPTHSPTHANSITMLRTHDKHFIAIHFTFNTPLFVCLDAPAPQGDGSRRGESAIGEDIDADASNTSPCLPFVNSDSLTKIPAENFEPIAINVNMNDKKEGIYEVEGLTNSVAPILDTPMLKLPVPSLSPHVPTQNPSPFVVYINNKPLVLPIDWGDATKSHIEGEWLSCIFNEPTHILAEAVCLLTMPMSVSTHYSPIDTLFSLYKCKTMKKNNTYLACDTDRLHIPAKFAFCSIEDPRAIAYAC